MATIHESGQSKWTRRCAIIGVSAFISLAVVSAAFAQSVSSGTIEGTVKDESNAVLPGVAITVTSPRCRSASSCRCPTRRGSIDS